MIRATVYSLAGLVIGFVVGKYYCIYGWKVPPLSRPKKNANADYDPSAPIPKFIPELRTNEFGEPVVVKEEVHHASPVPRSIAIVLLVLAALSVAYNAVQQVERTNDAKRNDRAQSRQIAANKATVDKLSHQQAIIDANEQRLEDLVLAISTAKAPSQVTDAIQRFLKDSAQAKQQEQQYQQRQPVGGSTASPSAYRQQSQPSPSPQSRSPSPRPSHSESPQPSHSPSASPTASHIVCVEGLLGRVICLPPYGQSEDTRVDLVSHSTASTADNAWWYLGVTGFLLTAGALHLILHHRRRRPL